jgi:3-hydroxy-3-methylglutaryl CoA synthase
MPGIIAASGYLPRYRLSRSAIVQAGSWLDPALKGLAKSERTVCDWDEDAVTMGVEAARGCLARAEGVRPTGLLFASTTMPFADRQNSAILANCLDLVGLERAADVGQSQRAGTTALLLGLDAVEGGTPGPRLVVAADRRLARTGSAQEAGIGHGAAAILVGDGPVIAEYLGAASVTRDFVDHFRKAGARYDYYWEERWIRDEGYLKIAVEGCRAALERVGIEGGQVDRLVFGSTIRGVREAVAKALGLGPDRLADDLSQGCGDTGAAHPLLMLVRALEEARSGQTILVAGFGQGADAALFRTTERVTRQAPGPTVAEQLAGGIVESNYLKFLAFQGGVEMEWGPRAEQDAKTAISAATRHEHEFGAFQAGRCPACGTLQFPRAKICVNPSCRAVGTQEPHRLAESEARVASFTEDWLAFTPHPPTCYGMIEFAEGVKLMAQFTSDAAGRVKVGTPLRMVLRIKDVDQFRGYHRYFWKAQPKA